MHDPTLQLAIFGRMALAAALGFIVGFERESRGKAAGERTIALIAAGAAAFAALAAEAFPQTGGQILAGVATGVGFLGIGVIWRLQMGPARGLTTAAATWTVAATGVLAGVGLLPDGDPRDRDHAADPRGRVHARGRRPAPSDDARSRPARPIARSRERLNTSSIIGGVSLPVNVFCWLGWKHPISVNGPRAASAP